MIAEDRNGNRYYDHKLTAIKKDDLLPSVRPVTSGGSGSKSPFSVNYDKRLFDLLQDFQSAEAINSSSNRDFSVSPRREAEFVESARETRERIAQQLKAAGADDETANAGGEVWANHLLARARALGMDEYGQLRPDALTPADLDNLSVRSEKNAEADWDGDVYDQAVRDGLNMAERVPVVDLSGVADRAKTANVKALTEYLKTLIKDGPSISRDALAFLNLPKDSYHLGHIAHSGAPIYRKEKSIRNASVLSLPELMKNAVLVESGPNRKKNKKPGVRMYHRFYVPVATREGIATVRIVAEEKNNSDRLVPLDVRVYDVIINKRIPRTQPTGASASTAEDSFSGITIREMLRGVKGMDGEYYAQSSLPDLRKARQLEVIQKANPMLDNYHTGVRDISDIHRADEVWGNEDEFGGTPDWTFGDAQKAIAGGKVTVYSSYPIREGVFVTPSRMEAQSYAGRGEIYSKIVPVNDVAWIDDIQGQFAPVDESHDNRGTFDDTGNIYNQSAWHGSPHRFDEFDLGAIGSGEGAQVHGWGLYFAQNHEVAERYRERLKSEGEQATVDYDAVEEYKTRHGEGTPEREALETVLEVFRDLGGEKRGEDSVAAYESTQAKIGERRMDVEGRIADLESLKKTSEPIDEDYLSRLKAKRELVKLEETALDKFFSVGWGDPGSLFEVDVPENDVLLDEDKPLSEQSGKVREAISKYYRSRPDDYIAVDSDSLPEQNGGRFLKEVTRQLAREGEPEPEKAASLLLNSLGIKGITYDGYQDGRCFVVFDDKAISVINRFNQRENAIRRGQIRIGSHGEGLVTLFKNADRSTFFHEIGHMMLDDLITDGLLEKANARTKADLETVKKYLGIEDLNLSKRHTFTGKKKERYVEAQERFARSFEAYLIEGRSPTAEMRSVFAKIKQWLINIYRDIKRLGVELSPEVREVFDRLLATPERGDFGPIFRGYEGEAAVEKLLEERQGKVVGAMSDPRLGENSSIDFVWGQEGDPQKGYKGGYGFAHIKAKHGDKAVQAVPQIIRTGSFALEKTTNSAIYISAEGKVILQRAWKHAPKNWVLTSYLPDTKKALAPHRTFRLAGKSRNLCPPRAKVFLTQGYHNPQTEATAISPLAATCRRSR